VKRLVHFVAALYPAAWRKRYGAEFAALLEDAAPRWTDVFDILWEGSMARMAQSKMIGICILAGVAGALAAAHLTPKRWVSQATLVVQAQDGGAVREYVAEFSRGVLDSSALAEIARDRRLYGRDVAGSAMEDTVKRMRRNIALRQNGQNGLSIEFAYPDPKVAQSVVGDIMARMMEANLRLAEDRVEKLGLQAAIAASYRVTVTEAPSLPRTPAGPGRLTFVSFGLTGGALGSIFAWAMRRLQVIVSA
jgi:uncharacterized protein involved in exopolysaccharide biosynthesis